VEAAQGSLAEVPASGYQPIEGETFFLLSDASFGSEETAQVRVEVPGSAQEGEVARYGGVDIVLYRVPDPLAFLARQPNLHRPRIAGQYRGEGVANTLTQVWDHWYKQTRRVWQRLLDADLRRAATEAQPQLSQGEALAQPTAFEADNRFAPLPGFELVDRFRYPVMAAQPIQPPKGAVLPGSSSDFTAVAPGNIMVPLGKLAPGLYLVEGIIGAHRAHTLVFVSNTQAITKISADQLMVWTADRRSGRPVAGARLRWSDGAGVLASADTDADGVATLAHASPERSFLLGTDAEGGVFVAENFYYDAEIYNTKLYAVTDRPMYRPGDEVQLKILGREFTDARHSRAATDGPLKLTIYDPAGTALFARELAFSGAEGADTRFRLPRNAPSGGYDIRFDYQGDTYGAAFRVAEYVKPHFEIALVMGKADLRTGEPILGKILLRYPNGSPVTDARLSLSVKSQRISLVDGEMQYASRAPVALEQQDLNTDAKGEALLKLPAASEPSRYAVTVLASDGAAYRVRVTREFLVERGVNPWRLSAPRRFSEPGQSITFSLAALGEGGRPPVRWEAQQLESREVIHGELAEGAREVTIPFARSGSYTVRLRDAAGNLLGATSHWVTGEELQATPGSVEIVLDKPKYQAGEIAQALITFPQPVDDALLTLERDRVEQHALLSSPGAWLQLERITPNQWRARIPVGEAFSPNITFSVLYTLGHDYVFANAGLVVEQPSLALTLTPEKADYRPGEPVNINIDSRFGDQAAPALLVVSVVDEMVYVLQPEIAPPITEFFYHVRRNNVRTTASLSFISYDMARSYTRGAPASGRYPERGVKVLERPRRDETDTAAWAPSLKTDAHGHARLSFTMPDSLTRWRITVRAIDSAGRVGQKTAYVRSDKPAYVKWTGPRRFRDGDAPVSDLVVFNRGDEPREASLLIQGGGVDETSALTLAPGPNHVSVPLKDFTPGDITATLSLDGQAVDRLAIALDRQHALWPHRQQQRLPLDGNPLTLSLPADASNLQLGIAGSTAGHFLQAADDLIAYPYGCVEQTASRLIPLALAYQSLPPGARRGADARPLDQMLMTQRERLIAMAGPGAVFSWWGGDAHPSAFLTGYAYFADWYASRSLGLSLPDSHWQTLLDAYAREGAKEPVTQRALLMWWMARMKLPVANLLKGVELSLDGARANMDADGSVLMGQPDSAEGLMVAELLVGALRHDLGLSPRPALAAAVVRAGETQDPFLRALLLMLGLPKTGDTPEAILADVSPTHPTLERAMTLVWLQQALDGGPDAVPAAATPVGWVAHRTLTGQAGWQWPAGAPLPTQIRFDGTAPATGVAIVEYDTASEAPATGLEVSLVRRLYRLIPKAEGSGFTAEPVPPGAALSVGALYVDELRLSPAKGVRPRFGLLEVPLPPGADVEPTTWGLEVAGLDSEAVAPFQRSRFETGQLAYAVPVEALNGPLTVRQLLRFGARGSFHLPPARFFRMYQPVPMALEQRDTPWQFTVE